MHHRVHQLSKINFNRTKKCTNVFYMKTDTAIIRLTLKTNKTLSNGLHPIMLRVQFNGRKEKSTGYSCSKECWDKENQSVTKKFPNYALINKSIIDLKNKVIERKLQYEIHNEPYTAEMLLGDSIKTDFRGDDKIFIKIVGKLIDERQLKPNTTKGYGLLISHLINFMGNDQFIINQLSLETVKKFAKHLEGIIEEKGSIRTILSKLAAVFNYAIEKSIITPDKYPFKAFNYSKIYPKSSLKRALTKQNINAIEAYFINNMLDINPIENTINYRPGIEGKLQQRWTLEFALAIYLLGYKMQGLAFTDMAHLTLKHIKIEEHEIEGIKKQFYAINTQRQKTEHPVPIVMEINDINYSLFDIFYKTAYLREDYIFPILKSNDHKYNYNSKEEIDMGLQTAESMVNKNLRKIAKLVNQSIIDFCKETKQDTPPLIREDITYYSARHSFATHYATSDNCNPIMLAKMMGRSINNIQTYISDLTETQDIIKERRKMFEG